MNNVAASRSAFQLVALFVTLLLAVSAQADPPRVADHVYVVAQNDTLTRIAARLHVAPAALAARNYLRAPYALRIGQRLRLPDGVPPDVLRTLPLAHPAAAASNASHHATDATPERESEIGSEHHAGVVTMIRARDDVEVTTNFQNGDPRFRTRMERFFRFRDGSRHLMHPRLLRAIAAMSDHFDGRPIIVLSGFRPQLHATQTRTRHSQGYAVDVRIDGVGVDEVHRFCETLENMGCGMYPRARFEHLDVRLQSSSWVDTAAPHTQRAATHPAASDETVDEVMTDAAPVGHAGR